MNIFTEAAKLEGKIVRLRWRKLLIAEARLPAFCTNVSARRWFYRRYNWWRKVERKVIEESLQALQERKPRYSMDVWLVTVRMLSGQIVEVNVSIYQRPWYASTSGVDWRGHVNRAIAQSAALLGFDIAVAIFIAKASILNYSLHQPRFSC